MQRNLLQQDTLSRVRKGIITMAARNPFLSSPDAKEPSSVDPSALSLEDWMRMASSNEDDADDNRVELEEDLGDDLTLSSDVAATIPTVSVTNNVEDDDNSVDISRESAAMFESIKLMAQASREQSETQSNDSGSETDGEGESVETDHARRNVQDLYSSSDSENDSDSSHHLQKSDEAPPVPMKSSEDIPPPRPPRSTLTVSSPPIVPRRVHQISRDNGGSLRRSSAGNARGHRRSASAGTVLDFFPPDKAKHDTARLSSTLASRSADRHHTPPPPATHRIIEATIDDEEEDDDDLEFFRSAGMAQYDGSAGLDKLRADIAALRVRNKALQETNSSLQQELSRVKADRLVLEQTLSVAAQNS